MTALYHPYIRPRNEAWLKAAALEWPVLTRLQPSGYAPHDRGGAALLLDAGVLKPQDPAPAAQAVSAPLETFFLRNRNELTRRYGLDRVNSWEPGHWDTPSHGGDPRLAYVHAVKASWRVVETLERSGLAVRGRGGDQDWVGMHPKLAATYMAALAQEVAKRNDLAPITDTSGAAIGSAGDTEWLGSTLLELDAATMPGRSSGSITMLGIQTVIPRGLATVPWPKILDLRQQLAPQLRAYRVHMSAFENRLSMLAEVEDEARAQEQADAIRRLALDDPLDELRSRLREAGLGADRGWQILVVAGEAAGVATLIPGVNVDPLPAIGTLGLLAYAASARIRYSGREKRDILRSSPVGYLYTVEANLNREGLLARLSRAARTSAQLVY